MFCWKTWKSKIRESVQWGGDAKYPESIMKKNVPYIQGIEVEEAIEIARHSFFCDDEVQLREHIVRTAEDFQKAYQEMLKYWNYERYLTEVYAVSGREAAGYDGICEVCNSRQTLVVDYQSAEIQNGMRVPNWRERLICPNCGCNNRQRFMAHTIFENYHMGMDVLIYEQRSLLYQRLKREIPGIVGFEYLGEGYQSGAVYGDVNCQDICELSFQDNNFDLIISNDVFEHTSDYYKAFCEAYRVLKPGGKLIFTVSFNANSDRIEHRFDENRTQSIYIFGWDILKVLIECGFGDAYGKVYYGMKEGYLGYLPIYFEALKREK
jgi:Methylase involved in ubiquinone/menaquinone biosynthesis